MKLNKNLNINAYELLRYFIRGAIDVVLVIKTYTRRLFDKMVRLYDKKDSNFEITCSSEITEQLILEYVFEVFISF